MKRIVHILLPDIRSAYNVGSIFRSADCFGAEKVYLTGTTPRPTDRFGRSSSGPQKEIAKTALGGEKTVPWEYVEKAKEIIKKAKKEGFAIVGIEQDKAAIPFSVYTKPEKILCIFGNEVEGIPKEILKLCDRIIEIEMKGNKESLNVAVCAGVALFELLR
jgi:23S rRNA (guanosine2251-2'-O)-methyltransferase